MVIISLLTTVSTSAANEIYHRKSNKTILVLYAIHPANSAVNHDNRIRLARGAGVSRSRRPQAPDLDGTEFCHGDFLRPADCLVEVSTVEDGISAQLFV